MDKDHSKHICWLVFYFLFLFALIFVTENTPLQERDFYGLEGYYAWFSFSLLVNFAILQLADVCDAPKKSYYHWFLFLFFHCLTWFVFLGLYDNLADVLDAPLKVGSNFGWAVLARSPHKSHITTTLHTESLCPLCNAECAREFQ